MMIQRMRSATPAPQSDERTVPLDLVEEVDEELKPAPTTLKMKRATRKSEKNAEAMCFDFGPTDEPVQTSTKSFVMLISNPWEIIARFYAGLKDPNADSFASLRNDKGWG